MKNKLIALIALVAGLAVASGTPEKEEGRKDRGDGKLCEKERKAVAEAMKKRRDARPKPDGKGKKKGKGPKAGKKPDKKK